VLFEVGADAQSSVKKRVVLGITDCPQLGGNESRAGRVKKLRTKGETVKIGVAKNVEGARWKVEAREQVGALFV
jgi:hypothetical protein